MKKSKPMFAALLLILAPVARSQSNPVPLLNNPLVPESVAVGGESFTLTVNGTGFVPASVVNWNRTPLTTTFVSGSQLTAVVPAADIAQENVASVAVVSPAPGGGTSNVGLFQASFPTASVSAVNSEIPGTTPTAYAVATGDFDSDGKPDLVAASPNSNNQFSDGFLQVLINNGNGTFQTPVQYSADIFPDAIATGDFNGDGKLDLAVANACGTDSNCATAGTVSVLLGNGDGTFAQGVSYTCVKGADWVVAADFNGDGKLDLAVAGVGISVFLGNGDGTFQSAVTYAAASFYESIAVGDMDRNGTLDLVFAYTPSDGTDGSVGVLLGNGDGTFQAPLSYPALIAPWGLVLADLNQDGKLDVAVVDEISAYLQFYLGKGDGTLGPAVNYSLGGQGFGLAGADFNGDGKLDLVGFASGYSEPFFLGNGDGTFQPRAAFGGYYGSDQMAIADFNGDGKLDLAVGYGVGSGGDGITAELQATAIVSPSSLTFPATLIGKKSGVLTATLTNYAGVTIQISSAMITGKNRHDFRQTNDCGSTLSSGMSCTFRVVFTPSAVGYRYASITITDTATNSPETITLTGYGKK